MRNAEPTNHNTYIVSKMKCRDDSVNALHLYKVNHILNIRSTYVTKL